MRGYFSSDFRSFLLAEVKLLNVNTAQALLSFSDLNSSDIWTRLSILNLHLIYHEWKLLMWMSVVLCFYIRRVGAGGRAGVSLGLHLRGALT